MVRGRPQHAVAGTKSHERQCSSWCAPGSPHRHGWTQKARDAAAIGDRPFSHMLADRFTETHYLFVDRGHFERVSPNRNCQDYDQAELAVLHPPGSGLGIGDKEGQHV
jgi:hypothetical protein